GAAEFGVRNDLCAGGWRGDPQTSGNWAGCAARAGTARGCAAARRVGDGELQRDTTEKDETRTKSRSESGHVWENVQRARGLDRGRHGRGAELAATGKRDGQLRESGAAHSREDRA